MSRPNGQSPVVRPTPGGGHDQSDLDGGLPSARPPQPWVVLLKASLVVAGLGLLVSWAADSLPVDRSAVSPFAVALAVLLNQAALYAAAERLRATLAAFDMTISRGQAFGIHLRSLFYFFFVPMSVGLEISRFFAIRAICPGASGRRLLLALLIDRLLGVLAAFLVVVALVGAVLPELAPRHVNPWWYLGAVALACLLGAALLAHGTLRRYARDLVEALGSTGPRLVIPIMLSFATLLLMCASVFAFANGAGILIAPIALTFALAASLFGMAIPVSLLGATLGEVAGVGTLALIGLTPAAAVMLASVAYCGRLLGAIQGAVVELWGEVGRAASRRKVDGV